MPLAFVRKGNRVQIVRVDAGQGLRARLTAMGLIPETVIDALMNSSKGPLVISLKGSRIILGHVIAQKIMVA